VAKRSLKECSLLEASGELSPAARKQLYAVVSKSPAAQAELEQARTDLELLHSLPQIRIPKEEFNRIGAAIKQGVHRKLDRLARTEAAKARWKLVYYAVGSLSAAAAALVLVSALNMATREARQKRELDRVAAINKAIDHLALYADNPNQTDQTLTDVESSIGQLQAQRTLANTDSRDMTTLLDALATVPVPAPAPVNDDPSSDGDAM
jgi:hypothetical protein